MPTGKVLKTELRRHLPAPHVDDGLATITGGTCAVV